MGAYNKEGPKDTKDCVHLPTFDLVQTCKTFGLYDSIRKFPDYITKD